MYLLKLELELQNLMKKIPVPSEAINKMSTEFPQIEMFVVATLFHYSQYASRNNNWPLYNNIDNEKNSKEAFGGKCSKCIMHLISTILIF